VFVGTKLSSASVFETATDLLDNPSVLVAACLEATLDVQCIAFFPCGLATWTWWLGLNHGGLDAELDAVVAETLGFTFTDRDSLPNAATLATWTWWLGLNRGSLDAQLDAVVAETLGLTFADRDSLAPFPDSAMGLPRSQGGRNASLQLP